jgi:ABC-type sugar transport system substrate-binding protein
MTFARLATAALLAAAAVPAAAADVSYELINNSPLTLVFFHTSPVSDPNWGADLLENAVLAPGESGAVTLYDASSTCDFDVKFVFEDGQELIDQVNVCELASYTLESAQ